MMLEPLRSWLRRAHRRPVSAEPGHDAFTVGGVKLDPQLRSYLIQERPPWWPDEPIDLSWQAVKRWDR